jgi:hypothetical protein
MLRTRHAGSFRAQRLLAASFTLLALVACDDDEPLGVGTDENMPALEIAQAPNVKVIRRSGDITGAVADFRVILGQPNNGGTPGEQPSGRREVNWDGVPAQFLNANPFPGNFFNVNSTRGIELVTEGNVFRVSDNDFADMQPTYGAQFNVFSPNKTFASTSARAMDALFFVAGTSTPAVVTGFGAVFSDVDRHGSTALEFYDVLGNSLGRYAVPPRSDANGLSFLGVDFGAPIVARVRLIVGDRRVGDLLDITDGGRFDLVVTDDFLYGEPHALDTM